MPAYRTPEHLQLRKQPKQQRTRQLLAAVCQATTEILEQEGLTAVNTNLIAEKADIDVASLYQFFANKESILYLVAKQALEKAAVRLEQFEQQHSQLDYQRFFSSLLETLHQGPTLAPGFMRMSLLWQQDPDFIFLGQQHRSYCIDFLSRQLRRYGSTWPTKSLHALCTHLFYEYGFWREQFGLMEEEFREVIEKLHLDVMFHLLDKAMYPVEALEERPGLSPRHAQTG